MKLTYDTQACGRCGGSGRYSWCQMHGDTCFGCNGSGVKITRQAATVKKAFRAWMDETFQITVKDIKVGDKVFLNSSQRNVFYTVTEIGVGSSRYKAGDSDEWLPYTDIKVKNGSVFCTLPETTYRRLATDDENDALVRPMMIKTGKRKGVTLVEEED